ncbi:lytic transglycosylase domain-containing protein [Labrenzia sp. DG1229]|uniref:lytic transglycosylase domain-containing protein n=1 Tax=Labrenzia sp. DG1229 TaxID=681847 RepID=UPI001AD8E948|nr:lytic transglycosylase domain-containing protein [Labrenzia sp. DG1229]
MLMFNVVRTGVVTATGLSSLIVSFLGISALPAGATVLEYDKDGNTSITQAPRAVPPPTVPPSSTSPAIQSIKNLTREIAIDYSGSVGVRKAGLDAFTFVDVFVALIERESAFNPVAVSPKGAQGLGQLMPGTAADMGVVDPFDAKSNLIGSAKYFTNLLAEFGSLELSLAAYNAGPERVRQYSGVPPFAETKAYISWIAANVGLQLDAPSAAQSMPASVPVNKDQPLKGDVSVWEF